MASQYPVGFKQVKGSYVTCTECGANKKFSKDCERCNARQKYDESLTQRKILTSIMDRKRQEIDALTKQNQYNQEQIDVKQKQIERNQEQIKRNQEQIERKNAEIEKTIDTNIRLITDNTEKIRVLNLELDSGKLSLDIERLEHKFDTELLSDDAKRHKGTRNDGTPATLETHCTIVRVSGHHDVYFGHVTLVITYYGEKEEYTWHYGVKTAGTLPVGLDRQYWQTILPGQIKYDASITPVNILGRFPTIPTNITLLDMMTSHFESCITFFLKKNGWPDKQIWGENDKVFEDEDAKVTLQTLKTLDSDKFTNLEHLKLLRSNTEIDTDKLKRTILEEQRQAQRKAQLEFNETERLRNQQIRMENINRMIEKEETRKQNKLREAEFIAAEAAKTADESLKRRDHDRAEAAAEAAAKAEADKAAEEKAEAEAAAALAEKLKAKVEKLKGRKARKAASKAETEAAAKAANLLLEDATGKAAEERVKVERIEQAAIEEKPILLVPPVIAGKIKKIIDSRRLSRVSILYYQKLIDYVYNQYTRLQNMTSITSFTNAFTELQTYVSNIIKYGEEVTQLPDIRIIGEDFELVIIERDKTAKFLKNKSDQRLLNDLAVSIFEKYCKTIADYVTEKEEAFSPKDSIKESDKAISDYNTEKDSIKISLVKYKAVVEEIPNHFAKTMDPRFRQIKEATTEILDDYIRKFEATFVILYEAHYKLIVKDFLSSIDTFITKVEKDLVDALNKKDKTDSIELTRDLLTNYRRFDTSYQIQKAQLKGTIDIFTAEGKDTTKLTTLYNQLIAINTELDPIRKYEAHLFSNLI